jgi:ribose transport system substrate-binding protein
MLRTVRLKSWPVAAMAAPLVGVGLGVLPGLSYASATRAATSGAGHYLIISLAKSLTNPAFAVAEKGAEVRIAQVKKYGINVKLEWEAPSDGNEATEASMIDSAIAAHPSGLLVDSLGPAVCTAVNEAVRAHIPVIMWDSDCPGSLRTAYVGSNNYQGGQEAAKLFVEAWKLRKGAEAKVPARIAMLQTDPGAYNILQRMEGFTAELNALKFHYNIVSRPLGDDDIAESVSAVETTLQGNASINGFYFAQPLPLLAAGNQLPNLTKRVRSGELTVVSFDTLQPELKWVEDGIVHGLVGQGYYDWGYDGLTVLLNIVKCHSKYPSFVNTGINIVTRTGGPGRETAASWNKKWASFAFSATSIPPSSGACRLLRRSRRTWLHYGRNVAALRKPLENG